MATLSVCDLCNANPKLELCQIHFSGRIKLINGKLPAPPPGFKYREDEEEGAKGKKFMSMWDSFGNHLGTVQFMDKPKKFSKIRTTYDLCETCFQKFIMMFESIRTQFQLQAKEIKKLDSSFSNSFSMLNLLGDPNNYRPEEDNDDEE